MKKIIIRGNGSMTFKELKEKLEDKGIQLAGFYEDGELVVTVYNTNGYTQESVKHTIKRLVGLRTEFKVFSETLRG